MYHLPGMDSGLLLFRLFLFLLFCLGFLGQHFLGFLWFAFFSTRRLRRLASRILLCRRGRSGSRTGKNGMQILSGPLLKFGSSDFGMRRLVGGKGNHAGRRLWFWSSSLGYFLGFVMMLIQIGQETGEFRHHMCRCHGRGGGPQSQSLRPSLHTQAFGRRVNGFVVVGVVGRVLSLSSRSFAHPLSFPPSHFVQQFGTHIVGFPRQIPGIGRRQDCRGRRHWFVNVVGVVGVVWFLFPPPVQVTHTARVPLVKPNLST